MSKTLVGEKLPTFKTGAVVDGVKIVNDFSLDHLAGKYVVFFFYPLDFTFVCPTELHAFQEKLEEFRARGAEVIGCSVDSAFSHYAWLNMPREQGGIKGCTYPIVADVTKNIARDFGVLNEEEGIAYRGLFLADKEGVIRHQLVNDLPLGRSVDEALRILDALIFFEENGEVCPANWSQGKKGLQPTAEGVSEYLATTK